MGLPNCTATGFAEKELGRAGEISATATVSEVKCSIAKRGGRGEERVFMEKVYSSSK